MARRAVLRVMVRRKTAAKPKPSKGIHKKRGVRGALSLQTTSNGLAREGSIMMSLVAEHVQVVEGLDGYTKESSELPVGGC